MGSKGSDEAVLVTGFPTFRGRKMVEELLANEPKTLVYTVIREKFAQEAQAAIERLPKQQRERLVPLDGDAAAMDLGLSGKEYKELAARIDRVHHLAHVTYYGAPRDMAESLNLGGTREVLELGRVCHHLRSLVIHSSAFVSGNRKGLVLEDELNEGQSFHSPVEETLGRAERCARAAMGELPIVVLRPTQIIGDSATGEVDRLGGPYTLIVLILSAPQDMIIPLPTRGDAPMHLVPIDYVVRAARAIGRNGAAIGRTFHLADRRPLTVRRVFEEVARAAGKREPAGFIPSKITRALLSAPGFSKMSKAQRAFVDLISTSVRYDTSHSQEVLAETGINCPPFESYVDQLVAYVRARAKSSSPLDGEAPHNGSASASSDDPGPGHAT